MSEKHRKEWQFSTGIIILPTRVDSSPDPVDQSYATRALYRALAAIGIDETERKKRALNFHAWRHTFNSLLVAQRIPIPLVQSVTGHLTDEMTQRYYHVSEGAMKGIREIQGGDAG